MSDPLRIKLKVVLFTSLGLMLSLGLASGLRWLRGGDSYGITAAMASPRLAAPAVSDPTAALPAVQSDVAALAAVSKGLVEIAKAVTPAVVSIDTRGTPELQAPNRLQDLFGPSRQDQPLPFDVPLGRGSGFLVSDDGYILTNNHVVARAERITVELMDGRRLPAELVGRDPTTDVAVLRIHSDNLPSVKLGSSEAAEVGELVMAIGNPGTGFGSALPFTVTTGIISAKGRSLGIIQRAAGGSQYAIEDLIQTDAVINPGNSGGPLVNYRGEVIGINTAIASVTGFYQGYGFAIPVSLAQDVMEDLIAYGRVRRAALGVVVGSVNRADARLYGLDRPRGVLVQDFQPPESPARKAGLQREDVIISIDGRSVDRVGQLQRVIASYEPGDRVSISVMRFGRAMQFTVSLMEAPVPQPEVATSNSDTRRATTLLGVQVRNLSPELASQAGLPEGGASIEGVIVTDVARFGPAAGSGLSEGWVIQRVNGKVVTSVGDFNRALEDLEAGSVVSLDAVATGRDGDLLRRVFNFELPEE